MEITGRIATNAQTIELELDWLARVIETGIRIYFGNDCDYASVEDVPMPDISRDGSVYAGIVKQHNMGMAERMLLILALAPHARPQVLDMFFMKNSNYDRGFTEFGGIKGSQHSGFIPTGETFAFIMAGTSIEKRIALTELFSRKHFFYEQNILKLHSHTQDEPLLSGSIQLTQEYLSLLTSGKKYQPDYTAAFPARLINTVLDWDDLVLSRSVAEEVEEIRQWIEHGHYLLYEAGLQRHLKRGYRALFYGPPGTGKTLTASLLGKSAGLDVYRIDLSMIVSKFIGETEKNLSQLFDLAENKNWILFFDEADALFGKRTQTKDSNDRYANQEVSYLLQRIEDFPGIIVLASNLKGNMDEAFIRRFQSMIYFPNPGVPEKIRLWESIFKGHFDLSALDFEELAHRHQISGGMIVNVFRYCALKATGRNDRQITMADVKEGISRELRKEGKSSVT